MDKEKKITVYGASWCGDCIRSEALLDNLNIDYTKVNIDENPEVEGLLNKLQNGKRKIPTIVFDDGSFLVEPSDEELRKKINEFI